MKGIKIVHSGDWHFDSPFAGMPINKTLIRKQEQRQAFSDMISFIKESGTDILLIAGDLFDSEYVAFQTTEFIKKSFSEIKNTKIFISPGNHDCLSSCDVYKNVDFGDNVHVFGDEIEYIELPDLGVRVYGFGFRDRFINEGVLSGFKGITDEMINIMVIHGELAAQSEYNPISPEDIENSNMDYIALGHRHSYEGINILGRTSYAYSGIPEGLYFDEIGEKGIVFGEVSKGSANLSFKPLSKRQNILIDVDISHCTTYEAVTEKIKKKITNPENLYKITLKGDLPGEIYFDKNVIESNVKDLCFYSKIADETDILQSKDSDDGILLRIFKEKLKEESFEDYDLALKYTVCALGGRRIEGT